MRAICASWAPSCARWARRPNRVSRARRRSRSRRRGYGRRRTSRTSSRAEKDDRDDERHERDQQPSVAARPASSGPAPPMSFHAPHLRRNVITVGRCRARKRVGDRDQARLRAGRRAARARAAGNDRRTPAACTPTCTAAGPGRCASTRASPRPRSRTSATATCSRRGRPGSPSRSTCRRSSGSTPTTRARVGEVGRTGVAIDSLADMDDPARRDPARPGLDLDDDQRAGVAAPAALRARRRGAGRRSGARSAAPSRTTSSRSTSRAGTTSSRRGRRCGSTTDIFAYCRERIPRWNTISISGYHIREAGSTAAQEIAFTLANGIAYVEAAVAAGLDVDEFAPRLSFFFNAHNDFFEEVAKFRAARRLWATAHARAASAPRDPRALALRFHAQTGGSTLTAQQPENNVVRVAIQALAAVCGGAQSLHTNGFDEALALPTERAATLALRTQQVLADEIGRRRHGRPARRLVLRRGADRRARGARARADRADRRARRRGRGDRGGLDPGRDRGRGVPLPAGGRVGRARDRRRQPLHRGERRDGRAPPARPGRRAPPARADGARRVPADAGSRRRGARRRVRRSARRDVNCCRRCARRFARTARSARSATRLRASSASTTSVRSDAGLRRGGELRARPRRCRGSRSRRGAAPRRRCRGARISAMPSSSRSEPSSRACGSRSRSVRRTSCAIGTRFRRPVTRSITGAESPWRAASHLFSVVRIRWKLGTVPADSTCSQSIFTSAWKYAASATASSTRVTASQIRSSTVPSRGCGRTSHQMCV